MLKKYLTGLSVPQQYVCVAKETLESPLRVVVGNTKSDVTDFHVFLGYKPLIIALKNQTDQDNVVLEFRPDNSDRPIATLRLKKFLSRNIGDVAVSFYEGVLGQHSLISFFHREFNWLRERLRWNPPDNISLDGNLYDMVRIAYAVPRSIFVMTVMDGDRANMFPTDLHGPISTTHYISSLRRNGKANEQVERIGKVLLSRVDAADFKKVYALGKNHMKDFRPTREFECLPNTSGTLNYSIPAFALDYIELKRVDSFDRGVHRIHTYEIVGREKLREGLTLSHIHQYYAQWRIDNKLKTEMLLR